MVRRDCQRCGEEHYSADTTKKVWVCRICGTPIPKNREISAVALKGKSFRVL